MYKQYVILPGRIQSLWDWGAEVPQFCYSLGSGPEMGKGCVSTKKEGNVRPSDEVHTSDQSQIVRAVFTYTSKTIIFSLPRKNKYVFPIFYIKTTSKPKTVLSISRAFLII